MTQPRTVKDEKEAITLPLRAYVMGRDGFRHEKTGQPGTDEWVMVVPNNSGFHQARDIEYPAKVLYVPTEDE